MNRYLDLGRHRHNYNKGDNKPEMATPRKSPAEIRPFLRRVISLTSEISEMQPLEYKLAMSGGRLATYAFFPIGLLVAFLSMRSYVTDGVTFILFDALTVTGICLSLGLALITGYWWAECGHGW